MMKRLPGLRHAMRLKVITLILNKKKLGKMKINDLFWTHQRTEITIQTKTPSSKEIKKPRDTG